MTVEHIQRPGRAGAGQDDRLRTVEEALEAVLAAIPGPVAGVERLAPEQALGRVVAEPVVAAMDLPPWANSAMDGYAIRSADVAGASGARPVRLQVVGEVAAGAAATAALAPGTALRIATGAPVPPGADAVVPVEQTTPVGADGRPAAERGRLAAGPLPAACEVHEPQPAGASIRARGSDLHAGDRLVEPGAVVTPATVALAAGAGVADVAVRRRPVVAVLATGDEVRAPGEPLGPAGIPDANGPGLRALARAAGAEVVDLGIGRDDVDDVLARLERGLAAADAVVVAGGVSVGPYDVVKLAIERVGRIDLWRVALQPGKPFAFGTAPARPGQRPERQDVLLFGLPGNPVSGFVTFELFVRPAIRRLAGAEPRSRPVDRAVLEDAVHTSAGRRAYLRVRARRDADGSPLRDAQGRVRVGLAGGQGSHVLSALAAADALAIVPEALEAVAPGQEVDLWWLDRA